MLGLRKGTQGIIHCSVKAAFLATLNKQMMSSLASIMLCHWSSQRPDSFGLAPQMLIYVQPWWIAGRGEVVFMLCVHETVGNY